MSIIDETWHRCGAWAETGGCVCPLVWRTPNGPTLVVHQSCDGGPNERTPEDAMRLIACAPEMARLLLATEWSGLHGEHEPDHSACPHCVGVKPEEYDATARFEAEWRAQGVGYWDISAWAHRGHKLDCSLAAVMQKAGLR